MRRLLNTRTKTIHAPCADGSFRRTECGMLSNVPVDHVETVSEQTVGSRDDVDRCGNCFPGQGGY